MLIGILGDNHEPIYLGYNENEHYYIMCGAMIKSFKANSMLNAFAKVIRDLCHDYYNEIFYTKQGMGYYENYIKNYDLYTSHILEHTIGLDNKFDEQDFMVINSKGKPLKMFKTTRNYYNIRPNCSGYERILKYVEKGWLRETTKDFFAITNNGIKWLETKYDIRIYES